MFRGQAKYYVHSIGNRRDGPVEWAVFERTWPGYKRFSRKFKSMAPADKLCERLNGIWERYAWAMAFKGDKAA